MMKQKIIHLLNRYQNTGPATQIDESDYSRNDKKRNDIPFENNLLLDVYQDDIFDHRSGPIDHESEKYLLWDVYQDDIISHLNNLIDRPDQSGTFFKNTLNTCLIALSIT